VLGNLAGNPQGAELHLTLPIPEREARHRAGELVRSAGGTVYECLQDNTAGALTDANIWFEKASRGYVAARDFQRFIRTTADFQLSAVPSKLSVKVYGFRPDTLAYDEELQLGEVQAGIVQPVTEPPVARVSFRPGQLPRSGRYRIEINGESFPVYFDEDALARGALGVVELYQHFAATDPYSPLDAQLQLRNVNYVIQIANRQAFFKYHMRSTAVAEIRLADAQTSAPFVRDAASRTFTSTRPLPMAEDPALNAFKLIAGETELSAPRPNPKTPGGFSLERVGSDASLTRPTFHVRVNL
jgi:hypothetical protein